MRELTLAPGVAARCDLAVRATTGGAAVANMEAQLFTAAVVDAARVCHVNVTLVVAAQVEHGSAEGVEEDFRSATTRRRAHDLRLTILPACKKAKHVTTSSTSTTGVSAVQTGSMTA